MEKARKTSFRDQDRISCSDNMPRQRSLPIYAVALFSSASVLFSLLPPILLSGRASATPMPWLVCLTAGVLYAFISRKVSTVITLALIYVLVLPYMNSPAPLAMILGTVFACAVYSSMTAAFRRAYLPFIISAPIISYCISLFLTGDALLSLSALVLYPPAVVTGIFTLKKKGRAEVITSFAVVSVAELFAAVLIYILPKESLSQETITGVSELLYNNIRALIESAVISAENTVLPSDVALQASALARELTNAFPSILVALILVLGFFVQRTACSVFECFELEELTLDSAAPIKASALSALVFAAAHVLSFTSSASHSPSFLAAAALNISIILSPLMICVGLHTMAGLPKKLGFLAIPIWIGAVILSAVLSSSLAVLLALVGAFGTVFESVDLWAKEHYGKGEDQ